jgi:hypothetical protein
MISYVTYDNGVVAKHLEFLYFFNHGRSSCGIGARLNAVVLGTSIGTLIIERIEAQPI